MAASSNMPALQTAAGSRTRRAPKTVAVPPPQPDAIAENPPPNPTPPPPPPSALAQRPSPLTSQESTRAAPTTTGTKRKATNGESSTTEVTETSTAKKGYKGKKPGSQSFTKGDCLRFFDAFETVLPAGTMQWEECAALYNEMSAPLDRTHREATFLRDKFSEQLRIFNNKKTGSTGRSDLCIRAQDLEDMVQANVGMATLDDDASGTEDLGLGDDDLLDYHSKNVGDFNDDLEAQLNAQAELDTSLSAPYVNNPFSAAARSSTIAPSSPAIPRITPVLQHSSRGGGRRGGDKDVMDSLIKGINNDHGLSANLMASTMEQRLARVEEKKDRLEEKLETVH
ncbi:hypothetical protein BJ508DRAFT_306960 [Ascobolus immersus RN42]|uniref:Uncharacterized protein n=1 Tax=Ascobolus immersus RN42 TaxID=1160509 RepID=A0A3N4I4N2_ASCIM|nr:hypothetical protein BJ508DRAFT_306960 [Ascobolus immersus RN42]